MKWRARVDAATRLDAWETLRAICGSDTPSWTKFSKLVAQGHRIVVQPQWFIDHTVSNAGLHRIRAVRKEGRSSTPYKKALAAYPVKDRPRGATDIKSVLWHAQTLRRTSPVVIVKRKEGRHMKYILLDGVHRLIAAVIANEKLAISVVNLP